MPRKQHTHHYIYKVTCITNGNYYIGMHSTSNLEDGYFGSGKRLWLSIKKFGKENHSIEILEWLPNRSSLCNREKELVNESLLSDPQCMNLIIGGNGGYSGPENQKKWSSSGGTAAWKNSREILLASTKKGGQATFEKKVGLFSPTNPRFNGKTHSEETKKLIGKINSESQLGERNSQYGTAWINKDSSVIKVKKTELDQYLVDGWNTGRRIKHK